MSFAPESSIPRGPTVAPWEARLFPGTLAQNDANSLPGRVTAAAAAHACSRSHGRMDGKARSGRNTICGHQQGQLALRMQVLLQRLILQMAATLGKKNVHKM